MSVVRNLIIRAGADFSQMRREMGRAQSDLQKFKVGMKASLAAMGAAALAMGALLGAAIKSGTEDAIKVEAAMQSINRLMGNSAQEFANWANNSASAFNMSKSAAIRYGATYGNLLSGIASGSKQTEQMTVDLLKASAVVASGTGRTIEDVMERIRSGMLGNTEAIEDLGINVNVALLQSTKAFRQFAGDKSWDQLDFQTQQLIRYYGILEQANVKFGASINVNTGSALQQFQAALGNVKLRLGQAFLPILNIVLPILTRLANALNIVMGVIAQFSKALFGKSDAPAKAANTQAAAVGGVGEAYKDAGKAAKEAAKSVAGFDEINSLSKSGAGAADTGSDGSSANTGLGASTGEMGDASALDKISESVQAFAEKVRTAFKDFMDSDAVKRVKDALKDIKEALSGLGTSIKDFMNNPTVQKITKWFTTWQTNKLASDLGIINGAIEMLSGAIKGLDGLLSGDWKKAWEGAKEVISGWYDIFTGLVSKISPWLGDKMKEFKETFAKKFDEIIPVLKEKWGIFKTTTSELWDKVVAAVKWDAIKTAIITSWTTLKTETATQWGLFKTDMSNLWTGFVNFIHWDDIKTAVIKSWTDLSTETSTKWGEFKQTMATLWKTVKDFVHWDSIKAAILATWDDLKKEVSGKFDLVKTEVSAAWKKIVDLDFTGVKGAIDKVWESVGKAATTAWSAIVKGIKDSVNVIIDAVNVVIDKINNIKIKIPEVNLPGLPKFGGGEIGIPNVPRLPRLKRGGIVDGETNMGNYVAGEAGTELIVPLENTSFVDKVAGAIGTAVMGAVQFGGGNNQNKGDVILQVDGVTFARVVNPYLSKEGGRIGGTMITAR